MKKTEVLRKTADLFDYKTIRDSNGNEYVTYANSSVDYLEHIED